jgi:hypothetical protein
MWSGIAMPQLRSIGARRTAANAPGARRVETRHAHNFAAGFRRSDETTLAATR